MVDIGRRKDAPDAILENVEVSDIHRVDIAEVLPIRVPCDTEAVPNETPSTVVEIAPVVACSMMCLSFCDATEGES